MKLINKSGQYHANLYVLRQTDNRSSNGSKTYICLCVCGRTTEISSEKLCGWSGTKSCGCYLKAQPCRSKNAARHKTHGMCYSREYRTWRGMIQRCENPKATGFANYGGRGITVCERWHSFESFLSDMGKRPRNASLDRIDNDKGYSPENCRWASRKAQAGNRRNNLLIEIGGENLSIAEWAEKSGTTGSTIYTRLHRGWAGHEAVFGRAHGCP